jgi:UDP-3-O-[3-hydroxymyristoyl] glucosamine N-acyltransferase
LKLQELADRLDCRLEGDGALEVTRVSGIEEAEPGDVTFFANTRYAAALKATRASAVIVADDVDVPCAALRSKHPYLSFAHALEILYPRSRPAVGVHPTAIVAVDAQLGDSITIGAFVTVGARSLIGARTIVYPHATIAENVIIGDDCVIHAQASVRERVRLGHRVTLQDGAVVGADGFGFARQADGRHYKIPQVGTVIVGDDVEIGAHSAIDRPSVGTTVIGAGTKIDNLVQVAHGVTVGRQVLLAAQVGVAGSTIVEDNVTLAGQVGVAGHLTIGAGTVATAQTGIPNSLEPGSFVSGYPAIDNREWLKASAIFRRLPELKKTIARLEERIAELESHLHATTHVRRK